MAIVHEELNALWSGFDSTRGELPPDSSATLARAMDALRAALEYDDPTLVRSHLEDVKHTLFEDMKQDVDSLVHWTRSKRSIWNDGIAHSSAFVSDPALASMPASLRGVLVDALGRSMMGFHGTVLRTLQSCRNGPATRMEWLGEPLLYVGALDEEIAWWQEAGAAVLTDWPWNQRSLPPVDRTMIAESRDAFARGEGTPIEDLIRKHPGA